MIRRRLVATTTADRRRDRAIRTVLRRSKVAINQDVYAAVWGETAGLDPELAALVYQLELARRSGQAVADRLGPDALVAAGKKVRKAVAALAAGKPLPLL